MLSYKNFYSILLFVFSFGFSFGQQLQLNFQTYSTSDGLCSNDILGTFQDSRGFLWIRTTNGLSRYDGIAFENFFHSSKDTNSVSGNTIYSICEMPGDLIFVGTSNGLSVFNNTKHCFENWRIQLKEITPGSNTPVFGLIVDMNKELWINFNGNLDVYDSMLRFKMRFTDSPHGKILKGVQIVSNYYTTDPYGNIYVQNMENGIACININQMNATIHYGTLDEIVNAGFIRGMYFDSLTNKLWYSPYAFGLNAYDVKNKIEEKNHFPLKKDALAQARLNLINSIVPYKNHFLCASENGLIIFNPIDKSYKVLGSNSADAFSLPSVNLMHLLISKDSLLWVSTSGGLAKCNLKDPGIKFYCNEFKEHENDASIDFNHFAVYKSEWVIIGTVDNGIFAYNFKTTERKHYFNKNAINSFENEFAKVYVDKENNVWVSGYFGLCLYHVETNSISMPPPGLQYLYNGLCITMFEDSHHDYWMSFENRSLVHCIYYGEGKYDLRFYCFGEDSFPLLKINRIKEDKDSNLWISTSWAYGFLKWDRKTNLFTRYPKVKSPTEYFSESYNDIWPDTGNVVWLATQNHGLIKYDYVSNQTKLFTMDDGLVSNNLTSLYKYIDGTIWIATDNGISHFDPVTKKFRNYNSTDGLPETYFIRKIYYDTITKYSYALTPHYVVYFNPKEVSRQQNKIPEEKIYMQNMQVNGSNIYVDFTKTIQLKPNENNLNLEFSCIDFQQGSKMFFIYFLDGVDKKWIYSGNRRFVNYTNLSPGKYYFKVRTSPGGDEWTAAKTIATFEILPPFYYTWWFIFIATVVIAATVYIVFDYRLRNKKAMLAVRERISRDLHDDIGSTLNSISIYSEIAKLKNTEETQRDKFLETIGSSSRNMIEQMNDIVWTVNPLNDKFENILLRMKGFASELTEGKNVQLNFDVDENCKNISLEMNERKNFYLIFKEAVNNAIKYSDATEVKVKVMVKENLLMLIVSDNGVGFETSKEIEVGLNHSGNGLRNMKARAVEIKGELKIKSEIDKGTSVELRLKI